MLQYQLPKSDPPLMKIVSPNEIELGRLTQQDGLLCFSGNASSSAKIFFEHVVLLNNKRLADLILKNTLLEQRLDNITRMCNTLQQELETINRTKNGT